MMEILQITAAFNFLLATFFIWYNKSKLDTAIYWFSFFLLGKGLTLLSNVLIAGNIIPDHPIIFGFGVLLNSFLFFYAPFLYIFVISIVKGSVSIWKQMLHFIPFLFFLVLSILVVVLLPVQSNNSLFADVINLRNTFEVLYFVQVIVYTWISIKIISHDSMASRKERKIVKWVNTILITFLLVWILFLLNYLVDASSVFSNLSLVLGLLLLVVLANITLFMLFTNPEYFYINLFSKVNKPKNNEVINEIRYQSLCKLVQERKLFKNPDLKIGDLSKAFGESSRNTSTLINTYFKGNYHDFINAYRIDEAKCLLENTEEDVTILSILYESGFNSKSVFNTVFKNIVGETPSSYRKKYITSKYGF